MRRTRCLAALCAPTLAILTSACGGDAGDSSAIERVPSAPLVVGGVHDTEDVAVVLLLMQDSISNPTKQSGCTGTVVSPHVVLTAAHCLDGATNGIGEPTEVAVFLGDDINDASQAGDPAQFVVEKEHHYDTAFDPTNYLGSEHDFGVVITGMALPPSPMILNRGEPPAIGDALHLIGYGLSDVSNLDSWGARQTIDAPIAGENDTHFYFVDSGLCVGDSGGPSIVRQGALPAVAGVHSYGEHKTTCTGKVYDSIVNANLLSYVDPHIEASDPGYLAASGQASGGAGGGGGDGAVTTASGAGGDTAEPRASRATAGDDGGCAVHARAGIDDEGWVLGCIASLLLLLRRTRQRRRAR